MVLLNGAFQKSKNPLGLASTSLRSELTKPQQIFSTSAKLSSKSELVCFIREGQDKVMASIKFNQCKEYFSLAYTT